MFASQPDAQSHTSLAYASDTSTDLPIIDEVVISSKKSKKRRQKKSKVKEREVVALDLSESDEEDVVPLKKTRIWRNRRPVSPRSLESQSPLRAEDGDDQEIIRGRNGEDDDGPLTPRVRRHLKRPRQMSQREREEEDDLAEDLEFLEPESDGGLKTPASTRPVKKNARQAALEQLKMRRSGLEGTTEINDHIDNNNDEDASNEELDDLLGYDDPAEDDDDVQIVSSRQIFQSTQDDDDFVVDVDENETLGVPGGIPLAFTRFAAEKPKNLFKYALEWFVQKKINPAFGINDEIYELTFKKLDDEICGLAGSKFTSAAWTPDFTVALQSRPEILVDSSTNYAALRDKCDACNRSGHPATFMIRFLNKPYDKETLEAITGRDDEDDDSDSESQSDSRSTQSRSRVDYDSKGRIVPAESTEFFVGKFCTANATTAHALSHWKYHLNEWVVTWLTSRGYCTAAALLERDKMSTKKRRKRANKIVDRMVDEGVLKTLWREFRNTADTARNSKQGRYEVASP
jgi:hypothetical protein